MAFGTLTQLVLENASNEQLDEVITFCLDVGLPVTLEDLGITDPSDEDLMAVAHAACADGESIYNMPVPITPEKVFAALKAADAIGHYYKD